MEKFDRPVRSANCYDTDVQVTHRGLSDVDPTCRRLINVDSSLVLCNVVAGICIPHFGRGVLAECANIKILKHTKKKHFQENL